MASINQAYLTNNRIVAQVGHRKSRGKVQVQSVEQSSIVSAPIDVTIPANNKPGSIVSPQLATGYQNAGLTLRD